MNGQQQPLLQLLAVLVLREVQLVEAGVGRRQAVRSTIRLVDLEPLRAGDALQSLEPFQRHLYGDQERLRLLCCSVRTSWPFVFLPYLPYKPSLALPGQVQAGSCCVTSGLLVILDFFSDLEAASEGRIHDGASTCQHVEAVITLTRAVQISILTATGVLPANPLTKTKMVPNKALRERQTR
jgi:hypothetical protein